MVFDRLENASFYRGLHPRVTAALDYLASVDFSKAELGRHEIDGERIFVLTMRYQSRPLDQSIWESHRRYLDVQYVAQGEERMGYISSEAGLKVSQPYSEKDDAMLFDARGDLLEMTAGCFAIFAPKEIHAPGLAPANGKADEVLKVVVKCLID